MRESDNVQVGRKREHEEQWEKVVSGREKIALACCSATLTRYI
jgi:hypothetical protein